MFRFIDPIRKTKQVKEGNVFLKPYYILKFFLLFIIFNSILLSCISNSSQIQVQQIKKIDPVEEISRSLIKHITSKYYSYPKKRKINVKIDRFVSNFNYSPLLNYFHDGIHEELTKSHPIILHKGIIPNIDALIQIDLIIEKPGSIIIFLSVYDAITSLKIHTEQRHYIIKEIKGEKFVNLKLDDLDLSKTYNILTYNEELKKKRKNAYIKIKAEYLGENYKEEDEYYINTRYNTYGNIVDSWISKYDTGYSGYYPSDIKIQINNETYTPDHNYILYEGATQPGRINLSASFRGARWDNIARQQYPTTGEYRKDFIVDVKENDNLRLDVVYGYNGKNKMIVVKVSRINKVYRNGITQEILELIEVFQ